MKLSAILLTTLAAICNAVGMLITFVNTAHQASLSGICKRIVAAGPTAAAVQELNIAIDRMER